MTAYKDKKSGTWYVKLSYKGPDGQSKNTTKRGFRLKSEALSWESNFYADHTSINDMVFSDFCEIYRKERFPRIKASTAESIDNIINGKLIPAFGELSLSEIDEKEVIRWQNRMLSEKKKLNGKEYDYRHSYINKLTNTLGAILNHACQYYGLSTNPVFSIDKLNEFGECQMKFWTTEQFLLFASTFPEGSLFSAAFHTLYWSGIREGELMALTWNDINLSSGTITVSKTMRLKAGNALVTSPKTAKGNRTVPIPKRLCREITVYKNSCFDTGPDSQAFPVSPWILQRKMRSGCKITGQTPIRIHDLRHSHVSLLIHLGFSAVDIAERMGHESTDITFHYAHLFPSEQDRIALELDNLRKETEQEATK